MHGKAEQASSTSSIDVYSLLNIFTMILSSIWIARNR